MVRIYLFILIKCLSDLMKSCPKLKNLNATQIASFLIKKFNEEKVNFIVKDFRDKGFTKKSLTSDKNNLFKFLVLVSYDRRPFVPYEIVWDTDNKESVYSVLSKKGILNLNKMKKITEKDLDKILRKCTVRRRSISGKLGGLLHLDSTGRNRGQKYAKVIKDIINKMDKIFERLKNMKRDLDMLKLLCIEIDEIYGFGSTIVSKFIMYTLRCMNIGNISPNEFGAIPKSLQGEWHNSKWVKRLSEFNLLTKVEEKLKDDPMAFDYFFDLDRNFCRNNRCKKCGLGGVQIY